MGKRIIVILAFITFVSSGAWAIGIGGAFSAGFIGGLPNSAMLSIKADKLPLIGIGFSIGGSSTTIGATADWWLYHQNLGGPLYLYVGPGGYLDYDNGSLGFGARLPIGLQFFVIKPLELFIEVAPRAGVLLSPLTFPVWGVQGAVGFRFWF